MIDWNDRTWINYIDEKVWQNLPDSTLKTRNNSEINFRCPICGDSRKNKSKKRGYFYRRTGTFYCFNCGTSMAGYAFLKAICPSDVFDRIIQDYKVLNFNNIVRGSKPDGSESSFGNRGGIEILSPSPSYRYLLEAGWKTKPLSDSAKSYLDSRKVPLDRRDMMLSIYDSSGREFIVIMYVWDDTVIYHQLANFNRYDINGQGPVKYIFPKDENINFQPKPVFNLSNVDVSFPYVICTEGVFDSLFVKNGVALGGRNLTEYQMKMVSTFYPRHRIVLAFDNDYAGMQSSLRHMEKYPDLMYLDMYDLLNAAHVKDLNDFVRTTNRTDVFMDGGIIQRMVSSSFKMQMKLKLNR